MARIVLRVLLVIVLLISPSLAIAEAGIHVQDTVAGFGTTVELSGFVPGSTLDLHIVSDAGEDTVIPVMTSIQGTAVTQIPSRLTAQAGQYRVLALSGLRKLADVSFDVLTDRVDTQRSQILVSTPLLPADGQSVSTVTVVLRDKNSNPLPGRPVQLVGSRTQDRITPLQSNRETGQSGRVQFAVQTQTPGEIALRAMDVLSGTMLDAVAQITAKEKWTSVGGFVEGTGMSYTRTNPFRAQTSQNGVVNRFEVIAPESAKAGDVLPTVTIKAVDSGGQVVESFTGRATITSTDNGATLPGLPPDEGAITFLGKARGVVTLPYAVSFSTAGAQKIIVSDDSGAVRGEATVMVTGASPTSGGTIELTSPKAGDTVPPGEVLLSGKGPAFRNLLVWITPGATAPEAMTEGKPSARGETQADGSFAIPATIPVRNGEVAIVIQSDTGDTSRIIQVRTDGQGPTFQLTFTPAQPKEGTDVALDMQSEPGLREVILRIRERNIALTENESGRYHVLFQAPDSGVTDYVLSASDEAGNVTEQKGQLTITGPELPQVQNVQAEPLARAIALSWDLVPDASITGYRIEAKAPRQEDAILDTPGPTDAIEIHGLKAGMDYVLTVRVLRGGEAGPRSEPITARTLGMELTATPEEGSLLLQWIFPDATPLSSFLLEYGSAEGEYSESRTIDGAMRAYTLSDLLGQSYLIRLTPIATTGQTLTELAVSAEGTPLAATAFHPAAGELIGPQSSDRAPEDALHAGAPHTTGSGLPVIPIQWILVVTAGFLGIYWYRRRKAMRETQLFLRAMHRKYHS